MHYDRYGYMSGWSDIEDGIVDYNAALQQARGLRLDQNPSYEKYGRIVVGAAADYALTPALILHLLTLFQWTAEKVDIDGTIADLTGITPRSGGDERYLGNEWAAGFTYRFAPNVAFDVLGAVLFVGDARDRRDEFGGLHDADDVYKIATRLRVQF